jgi:hypothetical protein
MVSEASPRTNARIAGLLYLVVVATGIFSLTAGSAMNAADLTASSVAASEPMLRLAFTSNLIAGVAYIGVVAILYELLKPVSRTLSVVAAFFGLAGCITSAASMVNQIAPLYFLGDADYLAAFQPDQLHALSRVARRLQALGGNISLMFFGFYCLLIGCLVLGAAFIPRLLGVVMIVAGLGWLVSNFAGFLNPSLGSSLSAWMLPVSGLGEILFTLWLLVMGVNSAKWREQAGAAGLPS